MADQYTEISFNAGEILRASQLNTVVQNINIINTLVDNINKSISEINSTIAEKADKPAENENYATQTYVNNQIAAIPTIDLSNYYTKTETDNNINAAKPDLSLYATKSELNSYSTTAEMENYVSEQTAAITLSTLGAARAGDLITLQNSLNLSAGHQNQFAVSDGNGNITWLEIPFAENSTY